MGSYTVMKALSPFINRHEKPCLKACACLSTSRLSTTSSTWHAPPAWSWSSRKLPMLRGKRSVSLTSSCAARSSASRTRSATWGVLYPSLLAAEVALGHMSPTLEMTSVRCSHCRRQVTGHVAENTYLLSLCFRELVGITLAPLSGLHSAPTIANAKENT